MLRLRLAVSIEAERRRDVDLNRFVWSIINLSSLLRPSLLVLSTEDMRQGVNFRKFDSSISNVYSTLCLSVLEVC